MVRARSWESCYGVLIARSSCGAIPRTRQWTAARCRRLLLKSDDARAHENKAVEETSREAFRTRACYKALDFRRMNRTTTSCRVRPRMAPFDCRSIHDEKRRADTAYRFGRARCEREASADADKVTRWRVSAAERASQRRKHNERARSL